VLQRAIYQDSRATKARAKIDANPHGYFSYRCATWQRYKRQLLFVGAVADFFIREL
jgi:hypothetical protein